MQIWVIDHKSGVGFEASVDNAIKQIGEKNIIDIKYARTDSQYSAMIIYK